MTYRMLGLRLLGLVLLVSTATSRAEGELSATDVRSLAREAYIYAYPMVENYLSIYQFALDSTSSQYKGPPNAVHSVARVFTPDDTGVVTPNSDTPYSFLIMDLRSEPLVVTLPQIEDERYYSLQLVDLYSHNVDYLGTRVDGNSGGKFLISGPDWEGETPPGIVRAVRVPTQIVYSQFRTQLFGPADLDRVKAIQSAYAVQPLSDYLGIDAPTAAPAIDWPPISRQSAQENFWSYANFLLQFAPPLPWENALRQRFRAIGVTAGPTWPATDLPGDIARTVKATGDDTLQELGRALLTEVTSSRGLFGSATKMRGHYKQRALGAMGGLYGLEENEALYESYLLDTEGARLNSSETNYILRFAPGALPPAGAFWSITMYDGDKFLVDNELDRYLINSMMQRQLVKNESGETLIYLQRTNPGPALESNWLPAPDGEMGVVIRIYLPRAEALDGRWKAPKITERPDPG